MAMAKLYPTHVPTSTFQKVLLSVGSAAMAIANPARGGEYSFHLDKIGIARWSNF